MIQIRCIIQTLTYIVFFLSCKFTVIASGDRHNTFIRGRNEQQIAGWKYQGEDLPTLHHRTQQANTSKTYYFVTDSDPSLSPRNNYDAALGNPMKGLHPSPENLPFKSWTPLLPVTMADHKWPLSKFLIDDPDIVGDELAFNWTFVEDKLRQNAARNLHAVIRFFIHWPGQPLYLPPYLLSQEYNLTFIQSNTSINDVDLFYGNPVLKNAIKKSILALGRRYDGDKRIFSVQAGFLGYWGEWHTNGCKFNGTDCLPKSVHEEAVLWYSEAFKTTHVQFRYVDRVSAHNLGFGFHDDSFTYYTLNGTYNGGSNFGSKWFFWNQAIMFNTSSFWIKAPMGGEVRPENDDIFADSYPSRTQWKQDFNDCTEITHATQMGWSWGWRANNNKGVNGTELQRALFAIARMGYNFEVDKIAVASSNTSSERSVDFDVTIKQTGVAPFYYPLRLSLFCNNSSKYTSDLIPNYQLAQKGSTIVCTIRGVSATQGCLSAVELRLESSNLYATQTIKWAQGSNKGRILLSIPPVPTTAPTLRPSPKPTTTPTLSPTRKPTSHPTSIPTRMPTHTPTNLPTTIPTNRPTKIPTKTPSKIPTKVPFKKPTKIHTRNPTKIPIAKVVTAPRTKAPVLPPTLPSNWQTDLYFVNVTSQRILYNYGKIMNGGTYKYSELGRNLSIIIETNSSVSTVNFTWPVSRRTNQNSRPFVLGGKTSTLIKQSIYLTSVGPKAIGLHALISNKTTVFRKQFNFTMVL